MPPLMRPGRPNSLVAPSRPSPEEIRAARDGACLSQDDAAALVGASRRTWRRWERGETGMPATSWEQWKRLAVSLAETPRSPKPDEIATARRDAGLTKVAAAAIARVSVESWQDWEAGRTVMNSALWADWQRTLRAIIPNGHAVVRLRPA